MKLIQKIKDFLKRRRNITWGRDILRYVWKTWLLFKKLVSRLSDHLLNLYLEKKYKRYDRKRLKQTLEIWTITNAEQKMIKSVFVKLMIIWCVLFLGGVTNAQDTVTVSCTQTCTVQGDIIQQIRSRLDSLNPTLQCVDAELVESQIIELVKKIHKAEKLTCEVPKPEVVIIETPIYRDPIPQPAEIFTTGVKEKIITKKKKWK